MKQLMLICTFFSAQFLIAQTSEPQMIDFYLKNAQLLPKKVTLISYSPGISGNGTNGYILFPGIKKMVSYRVGTKLYLANSKQVGVVMSGKRIDADKPFWVVSAKDANKIIKVN
jgi:hypothetical protein